MTKVAALGEAMIRLSPKNHDRLEFCDEFDIRIGGTELNFCVALSRLGIESVWISKLTNNELGKRIENEAKRWGVNTSQIIWTDDYRVGLYFYEKGSNPRPSNIIYDRKNSAFCFIIPDEIDFNYVLESNLFHTTGITLALSENCKLTALECLKVMKDNKKLTSFDINYRSKLWSLTQAREAIIEALEYIDILITSEDDLQMFFGIKKITEACEDILNSYNCKIVVVTRGGEGPFAMDNNYNQYIGPSYRPNIIDRIGAGDAFDAGFIYGYLKNDIKMGLNYGSAMAALKFSVPGDFAIINIDEIENLIKNKSKNIIR
ncbi:MAG: sugar kinase [Candidatus Helarchaeota archaeon]